MKGFLIMTDTDQYIRNYLHKCFIDMPIINIERDLKKEDMAIKISEIEDFFYNLSKYELSNQYGVTDKRTRPSSEIKNNFKYIDLNEYFAFRKVPLFQKYVGKLNNSIDKAISTFEQINPLFFKTRFTDPLSLENVNLNLSLKYTRYCLGNDYELISVANDKKCLLLKKGDRLMKFSAYRFQKLINHMRLKRNTIAIITDSPEIAAINNENCQRYGIRDILWLSWLGEEKTIRDVDWNDLKGRSVYYLLREHSGFGGKIIYETATAVKNELDKIGIASFKYISFLDNGICSSSQSLRSKIFPDFLSTDEADVFLKKAIDFPQIFIDFKNKISDLYESHKTILTPLLTNSSATIIYGDQHSGKSWFAMNIAFAVSQGKEPFYGWNCKCPNCKIVYINGETESLSFKNKMRKILAIHVGRINPRYIDNATPQATDFKDVLGFFPYMDYPDIKKRKLRWSIVNCKNKTQNQEEWCFHILKLLDNDNQEEQSQPKIVFLDNLFTADRRYLSLQDTLIRKLKERGWAVVIILQGQVLHNQKIEYLKRVAIDNVIKIEKSVIADPDEIKMSVFIEKGIGLTKDQKRKFMCSVKPDADPPTFERQGYVSDKWNKALRKSRSQLNNEIIKLLKAGNKGPAIAKELGISLSLVKKRKTELGLSKIRVKKDPLREILRRPPRSRH